MDGYDFLAQYAIVVLVVLCVALRDVAPMLGNMNIEPFERRAEEAHALLKMMQSERVA